MPLNRLYAAEYLLTEKTYNRAVPTGFDDLHARPPRVDRTRTYIDFNHKSCLFSDFQHNDRISKPKQPYTYYTPAGR